MQAAAPRPSIVRRILVIALAYFLAVGITATLQSLGVKAGFAPALVVAGFYPELHMFMTGSELDERRYWYRGIGIGALLAIILIPA